MVKNIFDEKLKIFGDCFSEAKNSRSVTHVEIFGCDGGYYFRKIHRSLEQTLAGFDHEDRRSKHYILYRSVSMKKHVCNPKNCLLCHEYEIYKNLKEQWMKKN